MDSWYERWLCGEASVVWGAEGPDPDALIEGHNYKTWYDDAEEGELDKLIEWAEASLDVVMICGNWYRKSDGRKMCDFCLERPTHNYVAMVGLGQAELCHECDDILMNIYHYRRLLKEGPSALHPDTLKALRRAGYSTDF